jgi:hypothetical protein
MHGIPMFLVFIAAVLAWHILPSKSNWILRKIPPRGRNLAAVELMLLKDLLAFFGFVYLLSGFWNLKLMWIMLVAVHLGPLTGWFLNNAFGKNPEPLTMRGYVVGYEIGANNRSLASIPPKVVTAVVFCYPLIAAIFYFRHPWGSPLLQAQAIKCTLLLLIISGYLFVSLLAPMMMASANLDEDGRQNMFFSQLASFIPIGVYLAIGAASFGINQNSIRLDVFGVPGRTLSLELLAVLFGFFAATTLIPSLVGSQRARVRELELVERARDVVTEIEDVLAVPDKGAYVIKLETTRSRIDAIQQQFLMEEPIFGLLDNIRKDPDKATEEEKNLKVSMDLTGKLDARARYLDALSRLQNELQEIIADLKQRSDSEIEESAAKWGKRYEGRTAALTAKIEELTNRKPILAAGLGSGLLLIASGILGEVAKSSWGLIAGSK